MSDISFPNSPSSGDTYTYNNITFNYDGEKWTAKGSVTNVDQTLSIAGNVITISGNNDTVDLTSALGNVSGGNYGDSNVASFLSTNSYSNVAYGNTQVQAYLDAQNYSNTAVSSSSETTFTADVKFNTGVEERFGTLTGQSGTVVHNCNDGHVFYHTTPAGNITANFTNLGLTAEYTTSITVIINQGVSPRTISAVQIEGSAQTIEWQGGSAPSGTANSIDAFSFTILNDAGSYIVLGQMVDFA